jgi:capsular polysaccharide biosynthesis protein
LVDDFPKPNVARLKGRRGGAGGGDGKGLEPPVLSSPDTAWRPRRKPDFPTLVKRVIAAGWRRRWLILIPILLMIPIGYAAATFLPQTYVVRTLLLLQEGAQDNPLARETTVRSLIQERVAGMDALLRSDQVLSRVVEEIEPDGAQLSERERAIRIADLRSELSLDLIGSDFIEIRLRTSRAAGATAKLETIVTHFLEALVVGRQGQSAARFLMDRKTAELEAARQARDAAVARLARARDANAPDEMLVDALAQREQALADAEAEHAFHAERLGRAGEPGAVGILRSPERVVVFDPPRDPQFSTISRMIYMGSALGAGILLGLSLAFASEWFNARVREPDELEALTGVPMLGRLPVFRAGAAEVEPSILPEAEDGAPLAGERKRPRRHALPAAVLVAAMVTAFLLVSSATVGLDRVGERLTSAMEATSTAAASAARTVVATAGHWVERAPPTVAEDGR